MDLVRRIVGAWLWLVGAGKLLSGTHILKRG